MPRPEVCAADDCSNPGPRHNNKVIQCYGGCDRSFHWKCIGMTAASSTALKDNPGMYWFCDDCKNDSLFKLHRKVDYMNGSIEAIRILLRRVETNLESKLETCYSMIRSLASIQSISNASFNAQHCCANQPVSAALDLSLHTGGDNDSPSTSATDINGKRKLGEDDDDDDDNLLVDDSVPEVPSKRIRNLQQCPTSDADALADLPTPTYASEDTSAATAPTSPIAPVLPDIPTLVSDLEAVQPTISPGNFTSSICPAEVGHDTAPPLSPSSSSAYTIYSGEFPSAGELPGPTYTQTVPVIPAPLPDDPAMDTSSTSLSAHQSSLAQISINEPSPLINSCESATCAPVTAAQQVITGNCTLSMCPVGAGLDTALPQRHFQPSPATTLPSTQNLSFSLSGATPNLATDVPFAGVNQINGSSAMNVHPVALASSTILPGNKTTGICPAGASVTAAPSFGLQTVPVTTTTRMPAFAQHTPFRCDRSERQIGPSPRAPSLLPPGNARTGICPTGASDAAASSLGFQPVPATATNQPTTAGFFIPPAPINQLYWPGWSSTRSPASVNGLYWPGQLPFQPQTAIFHHPGNPQIGIRPAEASGIAAPSSLQPVAEFSTNHLDSHGSHISRASASTQSSLIRSAASSSRPGKRRTGICPAEVPGAAALSNSFQPVPVYRFGSGQMNYNSQPMTHFPNTLQPSRETTARTPTTLHNQFWTSNQFPGQQNTLAQRSVPAPSIPSNNLESTLAPPSAQNAQMFATKSFYVKPFNPSTTVDQIVAYIQEKTGWDSSQFYCHRLTSVSRSDTRPLTFVSFKITVPDSLVFTSLISSIAFWPSFVSVEPFTSRRRS